MDPAQAPTAIEFGPFQVLLHRREVVGDSGPLDLGGRAFDVLMVLIDASGAVVSKDTLMKRVWPDRIVEENSLQAQIYALRRAFGADRDLIRTIAGRGYQFTGEIRTVAARPDAPAAAEMPQPTPARSRPPTNLPEPVSELIGRDTELGEILDLSTSHRLVTLTGAGGIGKTRLGFAIARRLLPRFADGVWAIELAPLSDPELVPVTVATALGLELASGTASPLSVANALRSKELLLVLDNCEHVVDTAARMAEALLRASPAARVIATSREPLRTEGEWVYPVPPLAVPAEGSSDTEDPLRYGAILLFVERARAAAPHFSADTRVAAAIAGICRRLDGIPLGIELAAARVDAFGIEGLAARLDDRFSLLTGGRRTALPRHQTLRATMDWSYDLLPDVQKVILRRLAVFYGDFTMDAAQSVAADGKIVAAEVFEGVVNLAAKSLVASDIGGVITYYRLLDTTRAYSNNKLIEAGELDAIARLHAEYYRNLFRKAESEAATRDADDWREEYAHHIGNLRAVLNWAFSDTGDLRLGVTLAAIATDFWLTLSLLSECCVWGQRALAHLGTAEGTHDEMVLQCGVGLSLTYVRGMTPDARAALTRALTLSEALADFTCRFRALYGLWLFALRVVDFRECLALAHQYERLAQSIGDSPESAVADWMLGMSRYYLGEHADAAVNLERARASYPVSMQSGDLIRFGCDMQVSALCYQAVTLWSLGFPDRAMQAGRDAINEARAVDHPVSLCLALAAPSSILLVKMGDLEAAELRIDELIEHADRHSLIPYYAFGLCSRGSLMATRGDLAAAERWLRSGLERTREVGYYLFYAFFLGELAEVLACGGRIEEGLVEIDAALRYANESESLWCLPEGLRIKGNILAKRKQPDLVTVDAHFTRALDWARRQNALSWELRAATSLAQLWQDHGRSADAAALLQAVYDRFSEGFATADLKAAKALLDDLS
jgi:non-specific serine/threonine protein kinase